MTDNTDDRSIVIRHHHDQPDLVLLDSRPSLAPLMGRFQPARYVGLRGGAYALDVSQLDALARFAAAHSVTLIDSRRQPTVVPATGARHPLPQCAVCGQPFTRGHQPPHCPGCGVRLRLIEYQPDADDRTPAVTCSHCLQTQRHALPYCQHCGHGLAQATDSQPQPPAETATREHLPEPLPMSASLDDTLRHLAR